MYLAIYGEKDLQVVPLAGNRSALEAAMAGIPGEYATLEKAFAPGFLDTLTAWIQARPSRR